MYAWPARLSLSLSLSLSHTPHNLTQSNSPRAGTEYSRTASLCSHRRKPAAPSTLKHQQHCTRATRAIRAAACVHRLSPSPVGMHVNLAYALLPFRTPSTALHFPGWPARSQASHPLPHLQSCISCHQHGDAPSSTSCSAPAPSCAHLTRAHSGYIGARAGLRPRGSAPLLASHLPPSPSLYVSLSLSLSVLHQPE